ncbi:MAG TPA: AI-2E family transporter [Xanthobacteraceae bacterium]|nr:AI-2E family transporter [Xanthobacteraceae bacterium]
MSDDTPLPPRRPARWRPDESEGPPIFVTAGAVIIFLYLIKTILLPFVLTAIVGYVASPLLDWSARRTRLPRSLFASLLFLLIVCVLAGAAYYAVPRAVDEIRAFLRDAEPTIQAVAQQIMHGSKLSAFGHEVDAKQLASAAVAALNNWISQPSRLVMVAVFGFAGIFGFFLSMVLLFYFLAAGPRIAHGFVWMVPPRHRETTLRIWAALDPVLKRYFIGVLVVVIYATAAAYVGLGLILGIKQAVLLACLTGVLEMIPVIGPMASAIIAGLVAVRDATGIGSIIGYAAYATVLRLSIDELLGPLVLGRAAHVHPVLVIFCFLSGGILFGIAGVIMAMPVALAFKHTVAVLYDEPT